MAISVNDVLRITAVMTFGGTDEWVNVYNLKVSANTTPDDDAAMGLIATYLDDAYLRIDQQMSTLLAFTIILGINITADELLPAKTWPTLVAGLEPGDILPVQSAACVFFRSLTPKIRASKFIPGMTETSNGPSGELNTGLIDNLKLYGQDILDGIAGPTFAAGYGAYNGLLARFTPVTSLAVPTRWRTQRRRRLGVGS